MKTTIIACIILHNMIVEDQRGAMSDNFSVRQKRPCFRPYNSARSLKPTICAKFVFQ